MRKPIAVLLSASALVIVAAVALTRPGFEEPGCACVPPPTLEEIAQRVRIANSGDTPSAIAATGRVWQAFRLRHDAKQVAIWEKRVIEVGDPGAIGFMVSDLLFAVNDEANDNAKLAKLERARWLLERAYPNRTLLSDVERQVFADNLIETKGAIQVLKDGVDPWKRKADSGDATAAFNLSMYYFWTKLDQNARSQWEKKGAELGHPALAYKAACCWRQSEKELTEGKRIIDAARKNEQAWEGLGDPWIASVLGEQLDRAETQIDKRLATIKH